MQLHSFRSTLCLKYAAADIASAAIYLALLRLNMRPNMQEGAVHASLFEALRTETAADTLTCESLSLSL